MLTFLALLGVAVAISGLMAFVFFWPMALVHLRDRHGAQLRRFGSFAFADPGALRWLATGRYRELRDPSLNGLCTPAMLSLWAMLISLAASGVLLLLADGVSR
jgi:hypothetical protein